MSRTAKSDREAIEPDFNGAAVIDDQGNEVAITEEMIRKAIHALDNDSANEPGSDERKS